MGDVAKFVDVLTGADTDPEHVARSDLNQNGAADGRDTQMLATVIVQ